MFKKVVSLALIAVLSMGVLTACGNDGANDTVFKIGGIGPLTGGAAIYGIAVQNGAQIAVDEINAAGGIGGVLIEFNMQDDEHDAEKAVNAYNSLKDWGMKILMGTVTSRPCIAVGVHSKTDNLFQITPSASSADVVKDNDNIFQVCFNDPNQGIGSAQYIGQVGVTGNDGNLVSNVAVIYDSSDVYSSGIYERFVTEAANQPFSVVATEAFTEDSNTDFSVQLQKAKDADAQLIFLPIYYTEASLILAQAAAIDYFPVFFGCDGLDGILTVENFNTDLAEGVILLTPFVASSPDAKTQAFVSEYQRLHDEVPNQFAAGAYDSIYVIKAALEQSNAVPGMSVSDLGDALKLAVTQITYSGLTGENMTWLPSGEVNKAPKAMVIVNGIYVEL
ncbi:MAG: ABC transporter substrate-binding protein [Lachnospiraceae bacterium]|nr:ABC transporter substrate-binding protein [Lachnospiraceae bacterium]